MVRSGQVSQCSEQQQLSATKQALQGRRTEEHEYQASAGVTGGLNLNVFAAVSGIFAGKKNKTTETDKEGKSYSVEHSHGAGKMRGAGNATLNATGSGAATTKETHRLTEETEAAQGQQHQRQRLDTVDQLGVEESKN